VTVHRLLPLLTLATLATTACAASTSPSAAATSGRPTIDGIVTVADGDFVASTYADQILAPEAEGHRDVLTTVSVRNGEVTTAELEVSNSVTAAPEVLALSPHGDTAFVTERLGQRGPGAATVAQLPPGDRLTAVDVSDPAAPALQATATVEEFPEAIAVHPEGTGVAVVANTPERAVLQIVPWDGAHFGEPVTHDLADLGITGSAPSPRGGVLATNVQWHPEGGALAVNITSQDRVVFLTVGPDWTVAEWGEPVRTGTDPFVGRFTPDGLHYLTSDWGRDLQAPSLNERLPSSRSRISVIELAVADNPGALHTVISSVDTDRSAEGLAVSPDGRWVATVNMRGTALPEGSRGYDESASVTLLSRDPAAGNLTKVGDYPLTGVLPEGGTFDPSGRWFLATVFEGRPDSPDGSGLQVFSVGPPESPGLTPVQRIPLAHGVHHVTVG
jgi:hypothetical protein